MRCPGICFLIAVALMLFATAATVGLGIVLVGSPSAFAQKAVDQPSNVRGGASPSDEWRAVKGGIRGDVTLPDKAAGVLIQPGEKFREWRNGALYRYGLWVMGGVEGAFDAMATGKVDANWAREHHRLWFAKTGEDTQAADD